MIRKTRAVMRPSTIAWLAAALAACGPKHPENPALDAFPPGVAGSTDVTYYDVHGRTAGELVAEMRRLGPKTAAGGSFFGETRSPIRWSWQVRNDGSLCHLTSIRIIVNSQITLPRWTPPQDTVPGLSAQWQEFIAALERHEIGHKDISGREGQEILHRLEGVSSICSSVNSIAGRLASDIDAAAKLEQSRYDLDTRHGITQGAVFPPRRGVQPPTPPRDTATSP